MKRSTIYLLGIVFAALLLGWGVALAYRAFKAAMTPSVCICEISSLSSDQAALSLKDLLGKAILEKGGSFAYAARLVQQDFPHCTSISCRQQSSGLVQAHVELDEPFCAVNDDMVMTTQGVVVLRTLYADEVLVGLPQLRIATKTGSELSPYLLSFLRHIPDSLLSTHEVVYRSDDEISLVQRSIEQRATEQRSIEQRELVQPVGKKIVTAQSIAAQPIYLCAVDTVVDRELLTRCDKTLADFEQQKTTSKKKARTAVVLDLRFDKHIILYPHMGGQVHG
jgi:hypothetical protein